MTKQATSAALIWTALLGIAAIFGSYFFACVFPFAAVATIAALTLDVHRGVALVAATWVANQIVGFAFMHFPQTFETVALGISLGLGALAAYSVAYRLVHQARTPVRIVAALAGAFVAYQLVIYAGALGFGGTDNFSPAIISGVALNDAIWFAGLYALHTGLTRALPNLFGQRGIAATA